jgi:Putative transmembrane protein (PGPGW)
MATPRRGDSDAPEKAQAPPGTSHDGRRRRPRVELSRPTRAFLFVAGWLLIVIGVAGLILPGIQGIITIVAGLAVLSVVSRTAHGWIRRGLSRWPGLRKRVERLRRKVRRRFGRGRVPAGRGETE